MEKLILLFLQINKIFFVKLNRETKKSSAEIPKYSPAKPPKW
jgi:hypothetical protein